MIGPDRLSKSQNKTCKKPYKDSVWNFVSAPNIHPMKVKINVNRPGTSPGLIFTAPFTQYGTKMVGQTGALIMDSCGEPVWFKPLCSNYIQNADFKVQTFYGEPVLTMWQGTMAGTQCSDSNLPTGDPEPGAYYTILDKYYNVIKKITAQKGYTADPHEFIITRKNTALFIAKKLIPVDLSCFGGTGNGYIDDCSIQEVDIETGKLLFFWNAYCHIQPEDSMIPASTACKTNHIWDCYHLNSIDESPDHSLIISMRNMCAVYRIDKRCGRVLWQLGGRNSDFKIKQNASFSWQNDARYEPKNKISMFDNACCASSDSIPQSQSHGLILDLDFCTACAFTMRTYFHEPALYVPHMGNIQKLPNENRFLGWGQEPYLSEYSKEGNSIKDPCQNLLFDMRFPNKNMSYRSLKYPWIGCPLYPPSVAAFHKCNTTNIFVSWNGSTETTAWQVLSGQSPSCLLTALKTTPRTGFETQIRLCTDDEYYQVNALDCHGNVIGNSPVISIRKKCEC